MHESRNNTQADLKDALECLHKLVSAVRRSAAPNAKFNLSSRFWRVESFYKPYYHVVRNRFPDARVSLCDQIGRAMSQRRSWIMFAQRRGVKLVQNRDMDAIAPYLAGGVSSTLSLTSEMPWISHVETHDSQQRSSMSSSPASVQRSALYRQFFQGGQTSASTVGLENRPEADNDDFEYPDPPDSHHPCPYCLEPLTVMTKEEWTHHYDEDTKPFICLSEDCTSPLKFFSNYTAWEKHMTEHHDLDWVQKIHSKVWACDVKHPEKVFKDQADFEKHLRNEHDHMGHLQIRVLLKRKQRIAPREPAVCPLCESSVEGVKPNVCTTRSPEQDPRKQIWHHISEHLYSLLKVCVPTESLTEGGEIPPSSVKLDPDSLTSKQRGSSRTDESQSQGSEAGSAGLLDSDFDDDATYDDDAAYDDEAAYDDDDAAYQFQDSSTRYAGPLRPPHDQAAPTQEHASFSHDYPQNVFFRSADLDRHIKHAYSKLPTEQADPTQEPAFLDSDYSQKVSGRPVDLDRHIKHVYSKTPGNPALPSPEYVCLYDGCQRKAFRRAADLDRHIKHVHLKPPDLYFCDYNRCPRNETALAASTASTSQHPSETVASHSSSSGKVAISAFHRKDHARAHYRDYHREDLCRRNGKEPAEWFDNRNISSSWWRCTKCLRKISYSRCGWECRDCGQMLEPERINARKRIMGIKGSSSSSSRAY